MRISGGEWIRRTIITPPGLATRPTSDSVRGAIFTTLNSLAGPLDGRIVLDAFAGSGALSMESLSRGARHVVMVEQNPRAFRSCAENISTFNCSDRATLKRSDVFKLNFVKTANYPFDLVLLDPPYSISPQNVAKLLQQLATAEMLAPSAIVVYEHDRSTTLEPPVGFAKIKEKEYGSTHITYLRYQGAS